MGFDIELFGPDKAKVMFDGKEVPVFGIEISLSVGGMTVARLEVPVDHLNGIAIMAKVPESCEVG